MDVDIGIRKDLQPQYTGEEIAVFLILNYLQNDKNENLFISVDSIGYFLTGRFIDSQIDKNLIRGIKKGFEGLKKEEDIIILDQNRNNYIINSKSCRVDTKKYNFIIVNLWEIQKIFSSFGAYGFNVLRFFVNIIGTINGDSKSWHMTQDDMVLSWGFSKNTVNEYLYKLEELELLYTFRSRARRTDKPYHRVGNVYGRYKDKNLIIQEGMEYLSAIPCYKTKRYSINRASIKLRYNHFLNNSPKYDDIKEVEKLYKDCIKYNESFKTNPNDEIDYLDLSVFEECGFKNIPVYESKTADKRKDDFENDNGGEPNSMETGDNDFSIEEIINMPSASDLELEEKQKDKQNIEKPKDDKNTSYEVPTRVIHMKKKEQKREIPIDVKIQEYADKLYEQHGYGTDYEISIFIAELSEKFPGLDDYGKYYNRSKKYHEMGV